MKRGSATGATVGGFSLSYFKRFFRVDFDESRGDW